MVGTVPLAQSSWIVALVPWARRTVPGYWLVGVVGTIRLACESLFWTDGKEAICEEWD